MNMNFNSEEYKLDPNKFTGNQITNVNFDSEGYRLDPNRWSIPEKRINNSIKKHTFAAIFFIIGIIAVSVIKNETRMIQREINSLRASIGEIKANLYETTLDHQVITSPENIDRLAKLYLDSNFTFYEKSQIKNYEKFQIKKLPEEKPKKEKIVKKLNKSKIDEEHLKTVQIFKTKKLSAITEIQNLGRFQKWFLSRIIKLFLGIPPVPGK